MKSYYAVEYYDEYEGYGTAWAGYDMLEAEKRYVATVLNAKAPVRLIHVLLEEDSTLPTPTWNGERYARLASDLDSTTTEGAE